MNYSKKYDVIVMGAGLAGMIAMSRLAASGFSVLGLERAQELTLDAKDLRSTAFLMPSVEVLKKAGLWNDLEPLATALNVMEIVDANEVPPRSVQFEASEVDERQFGFNLMNSELHATLRTHIAAHPNIDLRFEADVTALMQFEKYAELRLGSVSESEVVRGRLIIGADGRQSQLRNLLRIDAKIDPFDQMAQVFTVTHEMPHNNISTEVHLEGGPFTLVPRANIDGKHASAVVWMDKPEAVEMRAQLSEEDFNEVLNARSFGVRGTLKRVSNMGAFPMITLEAKQFCVERAVLVGEAAHVVPPIGAQGLNMSLRDIESLVRVAERGGIEHPKYLQNWARQRQMDVNLRKNGIRLLNNVSIGEMSRAENMRRLGLNVLEKKSPLKSGLMKLGLGG